MDFACELMDLCRGTQEVEAVLSEGSEDSNGSRDPLARLKMAMEYEEKKVSTHTGQTMALLVPSLAQHHPPTLCASSYVSVCCSSQLPAAFDQHLVWTRDGLHAVADSLQTDTHVACVRPACPDLLPCLHYITRLEGECSDQKSKYSPSHNHGPI